MESKVLSFFAILIHRQFLQRVGFSFHHINDGKLEVRTLFERNLCNLLLDNNSATSLVLSAGNKLSSISISPKAAKASIEKPILEFREKDGWIIMNSVLNEVSGINPIGFFIQRFI